jgi:hypothetical protein
VTALERRWVESEWALEEDGDYSWHEREVSPAFYLDLSPKVQPDRWWSSFVLAGKGLFTVDSASLAEAKSDAEAMYRQWVYDEYGVVLP